MRKSIFAFAIFCLPQFSFAAASASANQVPQEFIDKIKEKHGFAFLEEQALGGREDQPKLIGIKKNDSKWVVKVAAQNIHASHDKFSVFGIEFLKFRYLNISGVYERPLKVCYDKDLDILITEFLPGKTVAESENSSEKMKQFRKKLQEHGIVGIADLHARNIIEIDADAEGDYDPFYVIDGGPLLLDQSHPQYKKYYQEVVEEGGKLTAEWLGIVAKEAEKELQKLKDNPDVENAKKAAGNLAIEFKKLKIKW